MKLADMEERTPISMQSDSTKTQHFVELIDSLIAERLRLHLVLTSKTIGAAINKRSLVADLEKNIAEIKASLMKTLETPDP